MKVFSNVSGGRNPDSVTFYVLLALISVMTLCFSYVMAPLHMEGDQAHYHRAYAAVAGLGLVEALREYPTIIHTEEFVHLLIIWVFSSIGVDKNILMAVANAVLGVLFAIFLRQKGASLWMVAWITFSCYYLHAVFFTLERTKFALIFVLLNLLTQRRWWLMVAVFTHSMVLIPIALNIAGEKLFGPKQKRHMNPFKSCLSKMGQVLFFLVLFIILIDVLGAHVYHKFSFYFDENFGNEFFGILPLVLLSVLTYVSAKERRGTKMFFFLGLMLFAMLMGSSRINMIGYFAYLYFSNFQHQAFKCSIAIIGLYLLYKTVVYLANIYYFGG